MGVWVSYAFPKADISVDIFGWRFTFKWRIPSFWLNWGLLKVIKSNIRDGNQLNYGCFLNAFSKKEQLWFKSRTVLRIRTVFVAKTDLHWSLSHFKHYLRTVQISKDYSKNCSLGRQCSKYFFKSCSYIVSSSFFKAVYISLHL